MKVFALALSFLPLLALATPVAEAEAGPKHRKAPIEKRSVTCALTASDVRYHTEPNVDAPAPGQFGFAGTEVPFSCYTVGGDVNGDYYWNLVASGTGAGYWVTDYYITRACSDEILTYCS